MEQFVIDGARTTSIYCVSYLDYCDSRSRIVMATDGQNNKKKQQKNHNGDTNN